MTADDEIDAVVIRVLKGQSPDYLIEPHATAFMIEGLTPEQVSDSFKRLEKLELVEEQETIAMKPSLDNEGKYVRDGDDLVVLEPDLDDENNEQILNSGWILTDKGRA